MNIQTVTGLIPADEIALADGHAHLWIDPPAGVAPDARLELNDFERIKAELAEYRAAGGSLAVDCQPGGAGRDTRRLKQLSEATGVYVTATTGFHQRKYYPPDHWLWTASAEDAARYFIEELVSGTRESAGAIQAATIKVGYEGAIDGQTRILMEAVAEASHQTGALILFHTERGQNVEALIPFFEDRGVPAYRLYICHVDKRPDVGLHRALAQAGALLGYDTFARPKYDPDNGAWRLIAALAADGLAAHVAICLDLALSEMWVHYGGGPGMNFLPNVILPRLYAEGYPDAVIRQLTGGNIARYLVRHPVEHTI